MTEKNNNVLTGWQKIVIVRCFDDGEISSGEKLVLIIIASHLGDNNFAWPNLDTLMRECCLARPNLVHNIEKLRARPYCKIIPPSEGYKSNRYIIHFPMLCQRILTSKMVNKLTSSELELVTAVSKQNWSSFETELLAVSKQNSNSSETQPYITVKEINNKVKRKRGAQKPLLRSKSKSEKQKQYEQKLIDDEHAKKNQEEHEARKEREMSMPRSNGQIRHDYKSLMDQHRKQMEKYKLE